MADRSSRSSVNLSINTSPRVRPAQSVSHAVPEFVGAMRGVDPWAGNLSQAFNQFFGSISNTLDSVLDTHRKVEIQNEQKTNEVLKKQAQVAALESYQRGDSKLEQMPKSTVYKDQTIDTSRPSYSETYASSLGALTGEKLYTNMVSDAAKQQVTPENFAAWSDKYWADNYTGGTGNAHHDVAMQKTWRDNITQAKMKNELNVIQRAQDRVLEGVNKEIFGLANTPNGITSENYYHSIKKIKEAQPHLPDGKARSAVLGIWIDAASKTRAGALRMSEFLFQEEIDEDGYPLPSLVDRFPNEMQVHLLNLNKKLQSYSTIAGNETMTKIGGELSAVTAMEVRTPADMQKKTAALYNVVQKIQGTTNLEGISQATRKTTLTSALNEIQKLKTQTIQVNRLKINATTGKSQFNLSEDEINKAAPYLFSLTDFLKTKNEDDAFAFGNMALNIWKTSGGVMPELVVDKLIEGLSSTDPSIVALTAKAANVIDPSRTLLGKKLQHAPRAATMYQYLSMGMDPTNAVSELSSENFKAAHKDPEGSLDAALWNGIENFPTGKDKDNEMIQRREDYLFGDVGAAYWKELSGLMFDVGTLDFTNYRFAPKAKEDITKQAELTARLHYAKHGTRISREELRKQVARHFKPLLVPHPDGLIDYEREKGTDQTGQTTESVQYGRNVVTPWGETQNTVENVADAIKDIKNGFVGLKSKATGRAPDLIVRSHEGLKGTNSWMIFNKDTREPIQFLLNETFETQNVYRPDGQRYGGWRDYLPKFLAKGWDEKNIKFTGNLKQAQKPASMFLHPSIALVPIREGNMKTGKILFYQLAVQPHFVDPPDDYLSKKAFKELILGR